MGRGSTMPLETKKVLWTVISIAIVLVAASGIAVALFLPPAGAEDAPASIAGAAAPRAVSPDAYVRQVEPAPIPSAAEPASGGDSIIIIYGDKPASDALASSGSGAALTASGSGSSTSGAASTGAYVPAPPATAKPAAGTSSAAAKPSAKPSLPKTVTRTEYWIQAGSFTSRSRAEDLQRDIAAKGLSSIISLSEVDGRSWYRVRIGPYLAKTEADSWLLKIRALPGCDEAYISQQTVQRSS
jgi:DedD protein